MVYWYWLIVVGVMCFAAGVVSLIYLIRLGASIEGAVDQAAEKAGPWISSG